MNIQIFSDKKQLGQAAGEHAVRTLRQAIAARGHARLIAATGASQFEFLEALTAQTDLAWSRMELFHLDEYVGLGLDHPASFRRYLLERLIGKTGIPVCHLIDGQKPSQEVIDEVSRAISSAPIDVAFVGIGENGHLAFNDPPADFDTEAPYLLVDLDEACRAQQVGEGWFASLEEVPKQAISMSIRQILRAREILCVVPDSRKATAVKKCLEGPISPNAPASILRTHSNVTYYLDTGSAALLEAASRNQE